MSRVRYRDPTRRIRHRSLLATATGLALLTAVAVVGVGASRTVDSPVLRAGGTDGPTVPTAAGAGATTVPPEAPATTGPPPGGAVTAPTVTVPAAAPSGPAQGPPTPAGPAGPRLPRDPGGDPLSRARAAFWAVVPFDWSDALRFRIGLQPGPTSWSRTDGLVEFGSFHAGEPWPKLLFVAAHEFGHLVALAFGPGRYLGEPPPGWVPSGSDRAERFADCVATALTGVRIGSHGQPPCEGASLGSAEALLERGPPVPR